MSVALLQIELKRNQKLAEAARLESKQKMDALLKAATQKARAVTLLSPFAGRPRITLHNSKVVSAVTEQKGPLVTDHTVTQLLFQSHVYEQRPSGKRVDRTVPSAAQ